MHSDKKLLPQGDWGGNRMIIELSDTDRKYMEFGIQFEKHFINQGFDENRTIEQTLDLVYTDDEEAKEKTDDLVNSLPEILEVLKTDIQAGYEGDPAAKSPDEVIITYPAFKAIAIYRIAHKLYEMQVPLIPRIMTELAHQETGIDIHPGATIGSYFFIDHGTGVVVGETTTIGDHVKLYQHVTLGAKSFDLAEDGTPIKGIKRHPDIGNNVVIYSSATILGGDTKIGDNCVVGGNVWLTHSLAAGETITTKASGQERIKGRHEVVIYGDYI